MSPFRDVKYGHFENAAGTQLKSVYDATRGSRAPDFGGALDKISHQFSCWYGVRFEQEVPAIQNVSFHAR